MYDHFIDLLSEKQFSGNDLILKKPCISRLIFSNSNELISFVNQGQTFYSTYIHVCHLFKGYHVVFGKATFLPYNCKLTWILIKYYINSMFDKAFCLFY